MTIATKIWLKMFSGEYTINDIAYNMDTTREVVRQTFYRMKRKGMDVKYKNKYVLFETWHKEYIDDNVGLETAEAMAEKLKLPVSKVKFYIMTKYPIIPHKKWQEKEDELLKNHYKVYPFPELMRCFARTERAVRQRIYNLHREGYKFRYMEEKE